MDINYHIITGSKGGVGKSLFSLMQLVHKLEKKEHEYLVVILDLNNMNTDIRRSLSYLILDGKDNQPITISFGNEKLGLELELYNAKNPFIQKENLKIGYLSDPFVTLGSNEFSELIKHLNNEVQEKELSSKYNKVDIIIDTNFHFCNLFSQDGNAPSYMELEESFKTNNIKATIYFLWTYNQFDVLNNVLSSENNETEVDPHNEKEAERLTKTANVIENRIKINEKSRIRFTHVYTPVALIDSKPPKETDIVAKQFWDFKTKASKLAKAVGEALKDHLVICNDLEERVNESKRDEITRVDYVSFDEWLKTLSKIFINIDPENKRGPRSNFMLTIAETFKTQVYPRNVIILYQYDKNLEGYTDQDQSDEQQFLLKLKNMSLYDNFRTLYE